MYLCDDNSFIDESMKTKFQLAACFLLVGYLIFLAACGQRSKFYDQFSQIDSLADVRPKEADSLLRVLAPAMAESAVADSMHYALLRLKTDDKLYLNITDRQPLSQRLVEYFQHHNKSLLPTALFYAGRVCADLGDSPQALDYYHKALEVLPPNGNERAKSMLHTQTGYIFYYQDLFDDAFFHFSTSYYLRKKLKDTVGMCYNLRDMARIYEFKNQEDSALSYYQQALVMAKEADNSEMKNMMLVQMASVHQKNGLVELAEKEIKPALVEIDSPSISAIYYIASKIYYSLGNLDSTRFCIDKLLRHGNVYGKQHAYHSLTGIAIQEKNPQKALVYLREYQLYDDSIHKLDNAAVVKRMDAMYNYHLHEQTAARLKIQNEQRWRMLVSAMFVAIVCSLMLIFLLIIHRKNRRIQKVRLENLKKESEGKSKDIIMAKNRIAELEDQLATNIESALLQQEIFIQKSNLVYAEKMEIAQLERRQNAETILFGSAIYLAVKKKIEEGKAMNTTDWQAFENVINEAYPCFSARLRELSKLSEQELHVSLLLKARFTNKDIATLTCRERNSISMTCLRLYKKAFHEDQTYKTWADFIEIL